MITQQNKSKVNKLYYIRIGNASKPINKDGSLKLVLITMGCYHAEQQLGGLDTSVPREESFVLLRQLVLFKSVP